MSNDLNVIGYAVVGRDGHLVAAPRGLKSRNEAERLAKEWQDDLPDDLDWGYRAVAIVELAAD